MNLLRVQPLYWDVGTNSFITNDERDGCRFKIVFRYICETLWIGKLICIRNGVRQRKIFER